MLKLPKFPPLDPKMDITAKLERRRALTNAAWPDDLEVSDEELHASGYALDITDNSESISIFLGRGRPVKG